MPPKANLNIADSKNGLEKIKKSQTNEACNIVEMGILSLSVASSEINIPKGLAAIAATTITTIKATNRTDQPPSAASAETTALFVAFQKTFV